ncbi:MAG: CinA family protein [Eubacterium sp.]|nr:CinA family protein [Eubacterium sp.]
MRTQEKVIRQKYRDLVKKLIEKKISLSTMESATGGQIASLITDTEGASEIFPGGMVTYSNRTKMEAGIDPDLIRSYSVYSQQVAGAMAECCKQKLGTDLGIGVTGTMANIDPANPKDSEPGHVYLGLAYGDQTRTYEICLPVMESRLAYKLAVAEKICREIEYLTQSLD